MNVCSLGWYAWVFNCGRVEFCENILLTVQYHVIKGFGWGFPRYPKGYTQNSQRLGLTKSKLIEKERAFMILGLCFGVNEKIMTFSTQTFLRKGNVF